MKKFTKVTSIIMVAVMVCLASSCGNKKTSDGSYASDKMLELTVWETQGTDYAAKPTLEGDIPAEWLKNKTNVTVKNMYGNDGGQWDAKLTKLVAGDNLPDIVHCGSYQGPAHFAKLNQLGKVWELTPEILQKYAPNVWERTPAEYWEKIKVDGKILGIPYMLNKEDVIFPNSDKDEEARLRASLNNVTDVTWNKTFCFWVRDDILKDIYPDAMSYDEMCALLEKKQAPLGDDMLDIPIYSTKEYIDFMYKIRDGKYSADGKKVYAFGYDGSDNWSALTCLGSDMYGYKNHAYTSTWNHNTQRIEVMLTGDLVHQAAKTQNKMIRDGVIDPESLAHTSAQYKEKVMNGQYAIAPISNIQRASDVNKELEKIGKPFRYRPFITQVPAQADYPAFKEKIWWAESLCILKTLSEEELYQTLNWINVQYSDEYDKIRNWGTKESGLYTDGPDGKPVFTDERFTRYFIDGDATALPDEKDRRGLQGNGGLLRVVPVYYDRWTPEIVYKKQTLIPDTFSGFTFPAESEHVKNVKEFPPAQVWSSVYAEIPEVVTYWSSREQWENKFKIAFTAESDSEFDTKWNSAITELNRIVDIKTMEDKMTKIARSMVNNEE